MIIKFDNSLFLVNILTGGSTKKSIKNLWAKTPKVLCFGAGGFGALPLRASDNFKFSPCLFNILRKEFSLAPPCHK